MNALFEPVADIEPLLAEYTNQHEIITIEKGGLIDQGNGLLQTGLYFCIVANAGFITKELRARYLRITAACKHHAWPILWRSPLKKNPDDSQAHDDYYGWLAAGYFCGAEFPQMFYEQAEKWGWFIDIQNPGSTAKLNKYFARFPGFRIFSKMCARATDRDLKITLTEHVTLAAVILWNSINVKKSDSCIRDYCLVSIAREESGLARLASVVWFLRVRKKYGITGQAFAEYFRDKAHPLCIGDWG